MNGPKEIQYKPDPTENLRRETSAIINAEEAERKTLEEQYGQVWNTEELARDFTVQGFLAPLVVVRRKSDGKRGTLWFQHMPRFYWGFEPE